MTKRLVISMVTLVAVIALALAIPLGLTIRNDQREQFITLLERDALATASVMSSQPYIDWQATAEAAANRTGARVVVVNQDENLVADSDSSGTDRSFDRPEINSALSGFLTSDVRFSNTLGMDLRYIAAPIVQDYEVVAAVRLSLSENVVDAIVWNAVIWLLTFLVSVLVIAGILAWLLARSLAQPVDRLTQVLERLPTNLSARADDTFGPKEIRQASVALNATATRLEGLIERTQRVAADASHHLRTPLTGVRLRLEAISDVTTQVDVRVDANAAMAEVDRLAHRIDQILALTKTDSGDVDRQAEPLETIVRQRVSAAMPLAEERGIALNLSIDERGQQVYVSVPPGACSRILDELLGNALNYAQSAIVIDVTVIDDDVIMTVTDDGRGLSPDTPPERIFDRFFRAANSVPGGSGLGLALVKESAQLAGGDASVNPNPASGGLSVSVRLPIIT